MGRSGVGGKAAVPPGGKGTKKRKLEVAHLKNGANQGRERRRERRQEARKEHNATKRAKKLERKRLEKGKRPRGEEGLQAAVTKDLERQKIGEERRTRESVARKRNQKRMLARSQLSSLIEKEEESLRCWYPGKHERLAAVQAAKDKYDPFKRRGAAKPAEEAYPWLYPEFHAAKEKKEEEDTRRELEKGDDILADFERHWGKHAKTRELAGHYLKLVQVHMQAGNTKRALPLARRTCEADDDGLLGLRPAWMHVACLIDQGDLVTARALIAKHTAEADANSADANSADANSADANSADAGTSKPESKTKSKSKAEAKDKTKTKTKISARTKASKADPFFAMLLWDGLFIEYVSHFVLEEEGSSRAVVDAALERARAANAHMGLCLAQHESYEEAVDVSVVDNSLAADLDEAVADFAADERCERGLGERSAATKWSPREAAVVHFARSVSWWRDTDDDFPHYLHSALPERFPAAASAGAGTGTGTGTGMGTGTDADMDVDVAENALADMFACGLEFATSAAAVNSSVNSE